MTLDLWVTRLRQHQEMAFSARGLKLERDFSVLRLLCNSEAQNETNREMALSARMP
jgi:hypothetical protein